MAPERVKFKDISKEVPGLELSPNYEASQLRERIGIDIKVPPTKIYLYTKNRIRLYLNPYLRRELGLSISDLFTLNRWGENPVVGRHIQEFNTIFIVPSFGTETTTAYHENGHAYFNQECSSKYLAQNTKTGSRRYVAKYMSEGTAMWIQVQMQNIIGARNCACDDSKVHLETLASFSEKLRHSPKLQRDCHRYILGYGLILSEIEKLRGSGLTSVEKLKKVIKDPSIKMSNIGEAFSFAKSEGFDLAPYLLELFLDKYPELAFTTKKA